MPLCLCGPMCKASRRPHAPSWPSGPIHPGPSKDDDLVHLIHAFQAVMDTTEQGKGQEHVEQWRGKKAGPGLCFRPSGVPVVA